MAQGLQLFLQEQKWSFCIIGGIAVIRWGEPRFTRDIDICLFTGFGSEQVFIERLLKNYNARIHNPEEFAQKNRVLLLKSDDDIAVDIALAGLPYEERLIERSSSFEYLPGVPLHTCSAEDLIVLKAFADREQDWVDIRGIIIRQGIKLQWDLITLELVPLCEAKENPEILDHLDRVRKKLI
ncbi:nucleotidyltransferase [candidate division KSB1 bacterium]|nr:nucleotidyltransferase [candidate division KSB1 bacterium]